MKRKNFLKAFTLVELAVVLLVIGILAGLLIRNYGGFTSAARDARILADLRNVSTMLAAYYARSGTFPTTTLAGSSASWTNEFASTLIQMGVIANPNELPKHPLSNRFYRYYACDRDGTGNVYATGSAYILAADLESPTSNVQVYSGSAQGNNIVCASSTNQSAMNDSLQTIRCYPYGLTYCLYNY